MYTKQRPEKSVTIHDPVKAYGGYTLFAQHTSTDVWLINMKGQVVNHWDMPSPLGGPVRLLPNGNQLRINKTFNEPTASLGTVGGNLIELDWDGKEVWKYEDPYMHHDFHRLENGNTVIIRHVLIPPDIASKVRGGIPGTEWKEGMWGDSLREITPEGKVVWEWLGYEHMDPEIDSLCPLCPRTIWAYMNGIDVFPNGDIVASIRHINCLFIIDKETKAIKGRLGQAELGHQHNPTVLKNGNVLVFDNGLHRLPPPDAPFSIEAYSRVLEINPKNNQIEWMYKDETTFRFFSAYCSGAGRLPNGNTLICDAAPGRIFEVTPEAEIVWEFISPFYGYHDKLGPTNHMFQAHRYGYDYPGLQGKPLDPDRFDFIVQEKGKKETKETMNNKLKESEVNRRLRMLGY